MRGLWEGIGISWTICKQRLVTQFLQAGCSSRRPTNGVKALKVTDTNITKKVYVQLPTSADKAALPTFVAAGPLAMQLLIDISWLPGPQQQTCSSTRRPDGQTDRRTDNSCIDPALHTM